MADLDDTDFDNLLNDILKNPELILQKDLTEEQLRKLQQKINPYSAITGSGLAAEDEKKKVVVCSYTNLREDYLKRLAMTSLVGFIFQIQHEYDIEPEQRRWTPESKKVDIEVFNIDKLVERLENLTSIAKTAQMANNDAISARQTASDADLTTSDLTTSNIIELNNTATEIETRAAGLLYAITQMTYTIGKEASDRLIPTLEFASKFASVKELLDQHPAPAPPPQLEFPEKYAKKILKNFLDSLFKFDPSKHVRCGVSKNAIKEDILTIGETEVIIDSLDPGHLPLKTVFEKAPTPLPEHKEALSIITQNQRVYNAVCTILRDEDITDSVLIALASPTEFKHYLLPVSADSPAATAKTVPPQDTFHRWNYYAEVNYEELKTITEAIYPERSDLDWALGIWDVLEGTAEEIKVSFDKYCQRNQEDFPSSIKALDIGGWSLLADFKENRKKIEFYNRNTEVLKRILDRHADDKKLGSELMKNRIRQSKAKNISQDGPDDVGLNQYKSYNPGSMPGAEKVITNKEMLLLEKTKGNIKAAQELEVLLALEETLDRLNKFKETRELSIDEQMEFDIATRHIIIAKQMTEVPDNAIQIDVFTNDTKNGEFTKTAFYTKAEELSDSHVSER